MRKETKNMSMYAYEMKTAGLSVMEALAVVGGVTGYYAFPR